MLCPNEQCAALIPPQARYCPRCGRQLCEPFVYPSPSPFDYSDRGSRHSPGGDFLVLDSPARRALDVNAAGQMLAYALALTGAGILIFAFLRLSLPGL